MTNEQNTWPPKHRCENCGWWQRTIGLFARSGRFGQCKNPQVADTTYRSYVCERHTAAAYEDITPSLKADVQKIIADKLNSPQS